MHKICVDYIDFAHRLYYSHFAEQISEQQHRMTNLLTMSIEGYEIYNDLERSMDRQLIIFGHGDMWQP